VQRVCGPYGHEGGSGEYAAMRTSLTLLALCLVRCTPRLVQIIVDSAVYAAIARARRDLVDGCRLRTSLRQRELDQPWTSAHEGGLSPSQEAALVEVARVLAELLWDPGEPSAL
jgi:hypothetical protein